METKDFYFDLPDELIAQHPCGVRGQDRLMLLDRRSGRTDDFRMEDLPSLIEPGTLMVFNDSKVRRSRVYAVSEASGKESEFLFVQEDPDEDGVCRHDLWRVMAKNAKRRRPGQKYLFPGGASAVIAERDGDEGTEFRTLRFDRPLDDAWFEANGHIPLPPYIRREDTETDSDRYQTVYARETGSSAAPTAGLHFTDAMLSALSARGAEIAWVTLHVGLGTFLPVRSDHVEDHIMHEESFFVSEETAEAVRRAKNDGRPVLAVGTTSVRTLESAWDAEKKCLRTGSQSTHIFMYPGYTFRVADQLFTNFHTPGSTLVMLVCAFAGREQFLNAYRTPVEKKYRFFSYGDAMFIR